MTDFIVIAIICIIVGAAVGYIQKEKKKGVACIGCPHGGTCAKSKTMQAESACSCHSEKNINR